MKQTLQYVYIFTFLSFSSVFASQTTFLLPAPAAPAAPAAPIIPAAPAAAATHQPSTGLSRGSFASCHGSAYTQASPPPSKPESSYQSPGPHSIFP